MSFTKIIRSGNVEFIEWIIDEDNIEVTLDHILIAIKMDSPKLLEKFIKKTRDNLLNVYVSEHRTLLVHTVATSSVECVKVLLENTRIHVNSAVPGYFDALTQACHDQLYESAHFLLDQPGINVNRQDCSGFTALMMACDRHMCSVIKRLIEFPGINLDLTSKCNENALDFATEEACYSCCNAIGEAMTKKFYAQFETKTSTSDSDSDTDTDSASDSASDAS